MLEKWLQFDESVDVACRAILVGFALSQVPKRAPVEHAVMNTFSGFMQFGRR